MTRNRTKVWDLNYVTVIMSQTTKAETQEEADEPEESAAEEPEEPEPEEPETEVEPEKPGPQVAELTTRGWRSRLSKLRRRSER